MQHISQGWTLRQKVQIKHAISSSHSILTPGQPVFTQIPQCEVSDMITIRISVCKSVVGLSHDLNWAPLTFMTDTRSPRLRINTHTHTHIK